MVCVMGKEPDGDADFHFLRQDIMDMYDIYSIPLHGYHDYNRPVARYWFGDPIWAGRQGQLLQDHSQPVRRSGHPPVCRKPLH